MELWLNLESNTNLGSLESGVFDAVILQPNQEFPASFIDSERTSAYWGKKGSKVVDEDAQVVGSWVVVDDPTGQKEALSLIGSVSYLVVSCGDWKMIPFENIVASSSQSPTKVIALVSSTEQVQGAAAALQLGVDGLLLPPNEEVIEAAIRWKDTHPTQQSSESLDKEGEGVALDWAEVMKVSVGGLGDRVCIDLTTNLGQREGMLVGSSSSMLAMVHAETLPTGYVPIRPFRVNAGPVHSYILMNDRSTKYLSELKAGDEVLVTDDLGRVKSATIGRLKIEQRPLLQISFRSNDNIQGQVFLQQAETVRLIERERGVVSVTELEPGHHLLFRAGGGTRHIGKRIQASVKEL